MYIKVIRSFYIFKLIYDYLQKIIILLAKVHETTI